MNSFLVLIITALKEWYPIEEIDCTFEGIALIWTWLRMNQETWTWKWSCLVVAPAFVLETPILLAVLVTWARLAVTLCPRGKPKHLEGICLHQCVDKLTSFWLDPWDLGEQGSLKSRTKGRGKEDHLSGRVNLAQHYGVGVRAAKKKSSPSRWFLIPTSHSL